VVAVSFLEKVARHNDTSQFDVVVKGTKNIQIAVSYQSVKSIFLKLALLLRYDSCNI
jgi:hypothetical protein